MNNIKVLNFINALIVLFEDKNKEIYKRLLYYRHHVRNVMDPAALECHLLTLLKPNVIEMINSRDPELFNVIEDEPLNSLWGSCDDENKTIIWKWVQSLLADLI